MPNLFNILIGLLAGTFSGFFGIGGAVVLVPLLVYLFKFSQHLAQGTALAALLLPVGILAAIKYYQAGNINIKVAIFISLGFFIGGFIGANIAHILPQLVLRRLFGALLFCISMYMLLGK
ncbi:MAG: sulfite exporter TauE/SafE family protein [Candidatus Omnitrophica bacterium]|nr:sulfite exporter TauE/SafE family protein [Candidatus Omnitrophota bacterium]